jgi:hypothetical protein
MWQASTLARQGSQHPLLGPEPALGTSAKVARGVIRGGTNREPNEHWQSICAQRQAKGFLKKPSGKEPWGTAQSDQTPTNNKENMDTMYD